MGTLNGYLDFSRKDFEYESIEKRLKNYDEFIIMQRDTEIKRQAARCMECETPYCHALGCPLYNRIPEWIDCVLRKNLKSAYESLIMTNDFPEFTGRICPALCEASCSLSINMEPVTIKQIELYIIEKAFEMGLVLAERPKRRKKEKIAIIGSGPSGLSAAKTLNSKGYHVTVFEKRGKPGGILRYGIPNYKLPKWVLDRRIKLMEDEGIKFETNTEVGNDISVSCLKEKYDAILICTGAGVPRDLNVKGRNAEGIYYALDYLSGANLHLEGYKKENEIINAKGKDVLIIGGGDTGADCIGIANRQGARKIIQIEIMPKPLEWNEKYNPTWPDYPRILRTSSSHEEGCIREFAVTTKSFETKDNKVIGANCAKVEWINESGKFVMKEINGSDFFIKADLVILSMGYLHVEHSKLLKELGIVYNSNNNIDISTDYQTNLKGIYCAGDASTGASLVCKNIFHGRQAALSIDMHLSET